MRIVAVLSLLAATAAVPASAQMMRVHRGADRTIHMMLGDPQAAHVEITLPRSGAYYELIRIETRRVGAPGSRFKLTVDQRKLAFATILDQKQCGFDNFGSVCTIVINRGDRLFVPFLQALRTGHTAHLEIENAGNMAMSTDVSLGTVARLMRM